LRSAFLRSSQRAVWGDGKPRIVLPPPPAPRERILNQSEINRLLEACGAPHVRQFVEIMLATGQCPGTVEKLTWSQVDLGERIIHFDKTVKTHTKKRVRPVPMTQSLYRLLKNEIVRPAGCVKKAFQRAVQRAGLEDVTRYTLRHTYGNLLDQQGVDDRSISELMGHTNVLTTCQHYLKTNMDRLRQAVESAQKVRNSRNEKDTLLRNPQKRMVLLRGIGLRSRHYQ
jgi:integrase